MRQFLIFVFVVILSPQLLFPSTVFKATREGVTLVGSNGDSDNRLSRVWFFPAEVKKHGRLYFGYQFGLFYQGGMNDQGLVFHWVEEGFKKWQKDPGKKANKRALSELIMEECATTEQALKIYAQYNETLFSSASIMLVDKTGDSAIVRFEDGKLKVRRPKGEDQCLGFGEPVAQLRLEEAKAISKETVKAILQECLQRGPVATQYSSVYDLQNGVVYVYLFLKSKEELRFDITGEFSRGSHWYDLTELLRQILRNKLEKKKGIEEVR